MFLDAAKRLVDDPDNVQDHTDLGLILFMALRAKALQADGIHIDKVVTDILTSKEIVGIDEAIAEMMKSKNAYCRLVVHDDGGGFHFHFYDDNGNNETLH